MFKGQIVFLQGWWCVPAGWGRTKHPWLSPIAIELRGITCWNLCEMSMHIYIYIYYNIYICIICRIRCQNIWYVRSIIRIPFRPVRYKVGIYVSWGDMDAVPDPQEAMSCWRYRFETKRSRWIPLDGWMNGVSPNPIQSHPIPWFIIFPTIWSIPFLDSDQKIFTARPHRGTGRIKQTENHRNIPNCILCMKTNTSCRIPASLIVMDVIHSCSCARLMLIVTIFFVGRSGVPQFDGWSSFSTLRLPYIYIKSYKRIHIYIYIYIIYI